MPLARSLLAEAIGTFALVFAGCGAIMVDAETGALGHVGVAITFGLVIMAMIYAAGHVSGAHFNPAVTVAFVLARHFPRARAVAYVAAQLVGALAAAAILRASLGNVAAVGSTLPSGSDRQAFLWEVVLTFFLMFVIMAVATDTRAVGEAAAIAIGGTVGLDAMFGGPVSGASMNPARSLGPALVSGESGSIWVYIAAPLVGAALGALAYQGVRGGGRQSPGPVEEPSPSGHHPVAHMRAAWEHSVGGGTGSDERRAHDRQDATPPLRAPRPLDVE
jgi:MIP family channel proteins